MADAGSRAPAPSRAAAPFVGGGEAGALLTNFDWAQSPLGPPEHWTPALCHTVSMMLAATAEIVLFWGPDYVALYNDSYAPTIGDKHPRALARPAIESWTELWGDLEPLLAHVRESGETYSAKDREFYIERHGYGEHVYFDISYSPVREADGSVGGVLCIVAETTERVRAARAIAADRARLEQMFDQAPSFIAVLRLPGLVFELANHSYLQLVGHRDVVGRPIEEALPEVVEQGFVELLREVARSGQAFRGHSVHVALQREPGGLIESRFLDFVYQPITDDAGNVTGIFVEGSDVTDRRRAEERAALSEVSLRLATEAAEIGTWDLDLITRELVTSDRGRAMFGVASDGRFTMRDFIGGVHPDDQARANASFAAALDPAVRAMYDVEYRTVAPDQTKRWVAAKGRVIFDDADRPIRAVGITIEITARKEADDRLRESEERFRTLANSAPALIWLTDANGEVEFVNSWFEELLGVTLDDLRRDGWLSIVHPSTRAAASARRQNRISAPEAWSADVRLNDVDGRSRWAHAEARPRLHGGQFAGYVGCAVDVTDTHLAAELLERRIAERTFELAQANDELKQQISERERVEEALHQMQRLEAVGQLTSGVAHDFNNLLTVVLGNLGMIERGAQKTPLEPRTTQRLEHIRAAAERGAALTAQLLAFSRRQRLETRTVDLNDLLHAMQPLLESSLGGGVAIETALAPSLWPASVDPTKLELSILNLAINARDAMAVGGTLTLTTGNVTLGAPARHEAPVAGDYVVVAVSDNGSGMTDEVRARVFEPFFTTKDVGKGSGLGLAQVFGFAKQSGGGVEIDTVVGQGTTVRLFLPRSETTVANELEETAAGQRPAARLDRQVLVVDDDAAVRAVTADVVAELGCDVLAVESGAAGLAALRENSAIAAVIVDFAMPGMNGAEFAAAARALRPELPILFVTGYADLTAIADTPEERIVQKPYRAADLQAKLRRVLQR